MTVYTIQQLEARAAAEDVQEHSSTSSDVPVRNEFRPALPDFRVDIRREIMDAVRSAARAVTRAEIAKAVGRKKTTWLNACIEACVADGLLTRSQTYWKNGVVMYFYAAAGE